MKKPHEQTDGTGHFIVTWTCKAEGKYTDHHKVFGPDDGPDDGYLLAREAYEHKLTLEDTWTASLCYELESSECR